jgi:imidazolonepropionase-like amidohydrolase
MRRPRTLLVLPPAFVLSLTLIAFSHAATPRVHALVGARIVTAPGTVIPHGTIVIRDGLIAAVGASVEVPADARVWNAESLTVYPGLIDPYVTRTEGGGSSGGSGGGAAAMIANSQLRPVMMPQTRMADSLPLGKDQKETLRAAGFTAIQLVPAAGVFRGQSAIAGLGDGAARTAMLKPDAARAVALQPQQGNYPGSLMGAIAVVRQGFLDARWYRDALAAYARAPRTMRRPETDPALEALGPALSGKQPVLFATTDMLELLRVASLAREAGVSARALSAGDEYKRVKEVAATKLELIVPVDFPEAPDVANAADAVEIPITQLRSWNEAPANPATLAKAGVSFALTSFRMKEPKRFRAQVGKAIERGLLPDVALAAVTTKPAAMLGLQDRLGKIAPGMIANLTVTRGDLFAETSEVREVWVDGDRYETAKDEALEGRWAISWGHGHGTMIVALKPDTSVKIVVGADTVRARDVVVESRRLRFVARYRQEPPENFDLRYESGRLLGTLVVEGVGSHDVIGVRLPREEKKKDAKVDVAVVTPAIAGDPEAWRMTKPAQPSAVLVRNATIWTAGPQGILQGADLLVRGGKIAAVGTGLKAPTGALVIDAQGKHVAPGIIDEHSHSAILGNVNECTNSVTAEVRIQDVVNSESINIYRQLAGGTTVMHLLHGSCNAIGGQCFVIKNRWGESPDGLAMATAKPTIKFALGENPKRSNFTAGADRYPQTRAGVEQVIRDAFVRAKDYRARQAEWRAHHHGLPPRQDLQLEAIAEVIEGKRIIHCHSYRQDEILMLMRLAEEFGFRVGTFTHVLEGYKIADELAAHGAVGSTFSDWWAYKFEVIDAIPYNGYLMWDRGVTVCYNSDSDNLARRLNTEAGKAVKYGSVPEAEAIKFVTLNPAISLGIEDRVGSLEVGKDADFSIWDGSPLLYESHCEQTWIEGRKYFDLAADHGGRAALEADRAALVARAKRAKQGETSDKSGDTKPPPRYLRDADRSGNTCGDGNDEPFVPEAVRREREAVGE